ncbi:hypothetical protein COCOBI_15-1320 [Coccomyxa sp. Obi]|nr:hypothetical protein COCOBI_15-1320 [Coccomyxa sp. Obi]
MHDTKCSYHEIIKVDPDERTKAMKAVIKSQELAFEAGKLLLSTRAAAQDLDKEKLIKLNGRFDTSDEDVIMQKVVFERPMERNETPLERAKPLYWLHLLAAVPVLMSQVAGKKFTAAVQTAAIALALMKYGSMPWDGLLGMHGLSLWDYELVVRMHQSHAIFEMPTILSEAAVADYDPIFKANVQHIYSMQPTNNWNLFFCTILGIDKGNRCQMLDCGEKLDIALQVLREAVKVADDDGDDSPSICLRWVLCYDILLGAEGPFFSMAEVLSIMMKARAAMEEVEQWTNPKKMILPGTYWPCLGVAARYSAAVNEDPSFVHSMIQAYACATDLDSEKRHVKGCP